MPPRFSLQNDQPYTGPDDPLGFDAIAADLARLVLASRQSTPFTLGIEAAWGTGKSSLMQRLRDEFGRKDGIETVWFNAWTAKDQEALEGLIRSVLDKLDSNVLRRAMRQKRLMGVVASVAGTRLGAGGLVDAFWERMSIDPRARTAVRLAPSGTDPATEFLAYMEVRNRLRRGEMTDGAAAVCERYGLLAPGATRAVYRTGRERRLRFPDRSLERAEGSQPCAREGP
ncbi:MAG: P-loop NTPase fold protein [Egibacteraceae bacterium]